MRGWYFRRVDDLRIRGRRKSNGSGARRQRVLSQWYQLAVRELHECGLGYREESRQVVGGTGGSCLVRCGRKSVRYVGVRRSFGRQRFDQFLVQLVLFRIDRGLIVVGVLRMVGRVESGEAVQYVFVTVRTDPDQYPRLEVPTSEPILIVPLIDRILPARLALVPLVVSPISVQMVRRVGTFYHEDVPRNVVINVAVPFDQLLADGRRNGRYRVLYFENVPVMRVSVPYPFDGPQREELMVVPQVLPLLTVRPCASSTRGTDVAIVALRVLQELEAFGCHVELASGQDGDVAEGTGDVLAPYQRSVQELVAEARIGVVLSEKGLVDSLSEAQLPICERWRVDVTTKVSHGSVLVDSCRDRGNFPSFECLKVESFIAYLSLQFC